MQATVWRDKKVVGFLHNHLVEPCADDFVERFSPRRKSKKKINSHAITSDHIENFNGVDHKDRDTADWTVSLKSNRFYLRTFYWCLDGVIHAMHVIASNIAKTAMSAGEDNHKWKRCVDKNMGRYRFQMDLGIALMNAGISRDWKDPKTNNKPSDRPSYVRKQDWIPCDCKQCFFCLNNLTCGVTHPNRGIKRQPKSTERQPCTPRMKLGKTARYCEICVSEQTSANPNMTVRAARKLCKATTMGCLTCQSYVCEKHWPKHGEK